MSLHHPSLGSSLCCLYCLCFWNLSLQGDPGFYGQAAQNPQPLPVTQLHGQARYLGMC